MKRRSAAEGSGSTIGRRNPHRSARLPSASVRRLLFDGFHRLHDEPRRLVVIEATDDPAALDASARPANPPASSDTRTISKTGSRPGSLTRSRCPTGVRFIPPDLDPSYYPRPPATPNWVAGPTSSGEVPPVDWVDTAVQRLHGGERRTTNRSLSLLPRGHGAVGRPEPPALLGRGAAGRNPRDAPTARAKTSPSANMSALAQNASLVLLVAITFGLLVYAHRHIGR